MLKRIEGAMLLRKSIMRKDRKGINHIPPLNLRFEFIIQTRPKLFV